MNKTELLKRYALRRGLETHRVPLYAVEVTTKTTPEGTLDVQETREDISLDGRYYVVFRDATAQERRVLEAAAGRGRLIREGGRDIIEFHPWDLVEAAISQQLIVEMVLPQLEESGEVGEYHLPSGYVPAQAIRDINNKLTEGLTDVLARMIQDHYFAPAAVEVVEEAKNS